VKSQKKLVIASAVRDCSSHLRGVFYNIERIAERFEDVRVIFVESDSSDDSLQVLEKIKESSKLNVEVFSLGRLEEQFKSRTDRISYARNVYLEIAESSGYDYLLVLDSDDISTESINVDGLMSCFNYDDWDMMTANQPEGYYDIWALRHETFMPYDCWDKVMKRDPGVSYRDAVNEYVNKSFFKINEDEEPIRVKSAFGGAAFIKIDSIQGSRHMGHYPDGRPICEWVPFCSNLNNIFINPKFVNSTTLNEHIKINMLNAV
jgi:glycosyltransferase involved in cell wall biosynthesis